MATQKHSARRLSLRSLSSHGSNGCSKSLLVTFRTATLRRPVRSRLAEGQIAAEDGQPGGAECTRQRHEKRRVAVGSRAVRQDEAISCRVGRLMQKPSNWYFILRSVPKFSVIVHTPAHCSEWLYGFPKFRDGGVLQRRETIGRTTDPNCSECIFELFRGRRRCDDHT
jgi:hypothetical protein